jgi:hypothetical protein
MNDQDWLRLQGVDEYLIEDLVEKIGILIFDAVYSEDDARQEVLINLNNDESK